MTFAQWLKRLRAEQDLTQEKLAERIGCATPTLRAFETGRRRPSRAMAERLADCLAVPGPDRAEFLRLARLPPEAQPARPSPAAAPRPNLPAFGTALIGRGAETRQLVEMLQERGCRLVTVVGPGGIGKTRLALSVAAELAGRLADGAVFVSLAPIESARHVPAAILAALGGSNPGSVDPWPQLLAALAPRQLVLVLDGFEHLLSGAADATLLVKAVLDCAPEVQLVVTSRERLRVGGEHVVELAGLSLPTAGSPTEHSEAVLLFLERARQVVGDFVLTPQNAAAVTRLCQLVEGLPLAIELAAAWVRALTPAEIADEITRSADFLALADRDMPARHRNMRAVFDHSWALLSAAERSVLAQLSVFRGGCSRDAAEAVAGATLPLLAGLIDKSLVRRTQTETRARYDLHELVQQYAAARLAEEEGAELEPTRQRHLAHFAALAACAAPQLYGPEQADWLARLAQEHENLRKALEWALGTGAAARPERVAQGLRLMVHLDRYWQGRGNLREGIRWLERGLAHAPDLAPGDRAAALNLWGWLLNQQGDHARARALQEDSLRLFTAAGNQAGMATALDALGDIAWSQSDFAAGERCYAEALALRRALGDQAAIGLSLYSLGRLHVDHGSTEAARPLLDEAVAVLRACADRRGVALALNGLGRLALREGRPAAAAAPLREALRVFDALGNHVDVAECLEELAVVAAAGGHPGRALSLAGAAEALRERLGLFRPTGPLDWVSGQLPRERAPAEWAGFWAEGRALALEQVVALALLEG